MGRRWKIDRRDVACTKRLDNERVTSRPHDRNERVPGDRRRRSRMAYDHDIVRRGGNRRQHQKVPPVGVGTAHRRRRRERVGELGALDP